MIYTNIYIDHTKNDLTKFMSTYIIYTNNERNIAAYSNEFVNQQTSAKIYYIYAYICVSLDMQIYVLVFLLFDSSGIACCPVPCTHMYIHIDVVTICAMNCSVSN